MKIFSIVFIKRVLLSSTLFVMGQASFSNSKGWEPCSLEDALSEEEGKGRVLWAAHCGFLDDEDVQYLNKKNQYPSFYHQNGSLIAPLDQNASCDGWKTPYIVLSVCSQHRETKN